MRSEDILKEKYGKKVPFEVPEDYFNTLKSNVMKSLPEYPEKPKQVKLSRWQRLKPYVYLAAMFAGIWCMMQVFHHVSSVNSPKTEEISFANVEADPYDYYIDNYMGNDFELEDEVISLYPNMDDFKRDFYAQL